MVSQMKCFKTAQVEIWNDYNFVVTALSF